MTTSSDRTERVNVARLLLRQGYGYMEVVQACQDKYQVSEKTAKNYVRDARLTYVYTPAHLQEDAYIDYGRAEMLLQKAVEDSEFGCAGDMLDRRQRLRKELERYGATQSRFSAEQSVSDTMAAAVAEIIDNRSE